MVLHKTIKIIEDSERGLLLLLSQNWYQAANGGGVTLATDSGQGSIATVGSTLGSMELEVSWVSGSGNLDGTGIELTDSTGGGKAYNDARELVDIAAAGISKPEGYATIKISKAQVASAEVDLSAFAGHYRVTVTGTSVTNEAGSNDAASRAKLHLTSGSAVGGSATVTFDFYITAAGKLSMSGVNDTTTCFEPSVGVTQKIFVAVDGAQPTTGWSNKDTSVVITLKATNIQAITS